MGNRESGTGSALPPFPVLRFLFPLLLAMLCLTHRASAQDSTQVSLEVKLATDTTTGGIITMPIDVNTLDTTRSTNRNGR